MTNKQTSSTKWYDTRSGAITAVIITAIIVVSVGSRAIYTGSLQQYVIAFISMVVAVNRLAATAKTFKRTTQ